MLLSCRGRFGRWGHVYGMKRAGSLPLRASRCRRCEKRAAARTPGGLRCIEHAVEEYALELETGVPTWIPKLLEHARVANRRPERTLGR